MTDDNLNPREPRNKPLRDKWFRLRNTLNFIFIVAALATMTLYFACPRNQWPATICCFAAIGVKMAEVCIRMITAKKQ
jgi:sugar phosphate permease